MKSYNVYSVSTESALKSLYISGMTGLLISIGLLIFSILSLGIVWSVASVISIASNWMTCRHAKHGLENLKNENYHS